MADRRYRTAAWQRLRLRILVRDGYWCQVKGPRCHGHATSVHHILPSSTHPELFWDPSNLQAACGPCNYGGGARIAADNKRTTRARIAELERIIEWQETRIEELAFALAAATNGAAPELGRDRARPAIH
jgi:5-methylcytosine-specific restriction endonuclease McrA